MGLGAALGAGAAGAGLGLVAGPLGSAIGGILGLVTGALIGGDAAGAGTPAVVDPGFNTGWMGDSLPTVPPTSGGPSGGGPLEPFVPTSPPAASAPIETKPDPMTIGGASATDIDAVTANLNKARGGYGYQGTSLTRAPAAASSARTSGKGFRAASQPQIPQIPTPRLPKDSAPVEALENAVSTAARAGRIPTPNPHVPMAGTSKAALESAVKQSFAARAANGMSNKARSASRAGPAAQTRTNAGRQFTPGPPASPSAQGTQFAPVEALETVAQAGKQLAARTTDRFAGMGAKGRSNVPFHVSKKK